MNYPKLIELSLENDIKPIFDFFLNKNFSHDSILIMALKCPELFRLDIKSDIFPKLGLIKDFNIDDFEDLEKVMVNHPSLLCCSMSHQIIPVINLFKNQLEFENDEISSLILNYPKFLSIYPELIAQKVII